LKGSVVGFLLDLILRRRSGGRKSLDDLVRALYERYGRAPGLPEDGVENAAVEVLGDRSLHEWFDRAVHSTEELPLDEALAGVGLEAVLGPASSPDDKGGAEAERKDARDPQARTRPWLGATVREKGATLEVTAISEGSPAQASGLAAGDEIVALDGFRGDLKARLARAQPGQAVRLTVFRTDELLELLVTLAAAPRDTVTLVPAREASAEQLAARDAWLGARWPAP
jgi:predicted metalloprotease with PDZ domain